MSLSMSDMVRFQALELRVAELEGIIHRLIGQCAEVYAVQQDWTRQANGFVPPRRGRPPKNLEERMKAQEHDPIDAC